MAEDEGLLVGIIGRHVSDFGASCIPFNCGYELPVHDWRDVVSRSCFSFELGAPPFG